MSSMTRIDDDAGAGAHAPGWRTTGKLTVNDVPLSRSRSAGRSARRWPRRTRGRSPARAPSPAPASPRPRKNGSNTASGSRRGIPRPRSVTRTVTRAGAGAAADPDRRSGGRELDRVLDQVREHALELGRVGAHQRQVGRQRELDRVVAAELGGGRGDHVVQVAPVAPAARPRPASIRDRSSRSSTSLASRALSVSITSISSARSASVTPPMRERRARGGDRGQRRAQVVRDRVQDRGLGHLGAARGLGLGGPLGDPLALHGDVDQPPQRLGHALDRRRIPAALARQVQPRVAGARVQRHRDLVRLAGPAPARARPGRGPRRSRRAIALADALELGADAVAGQDRRRDLGQRAWPRARARRPPAPGSRPRRRAGGPAPPAARPRRPRSAARSAATTSWEWAIVSRWRGVMKKKLSVSTPSTAVTSAGRSPAPDRDRQHREQVQAAESRTPDVTRLERRHPGGGPTATRSRRPGDLADAARSSAGRVAALARQRAPANPPISHQP